MDVMIALMEFKDHILYKFLPTLKLDPVVLKALTTNLDSLAAYRTKVPELNAYNTRGPLDLAWQSGMKSSEKELWAFAEDIIYKNGYEREVKQNLANKQSVAQVFDMEVPQAAMKRMEALFKSVAPTADAPIVNDLACDPMSGDRDPETFNKWSVSYVPSDGDSVTNEIISKFQALAMTLVEQSIRIVLEQRMTR